MPSAPMARAQDQTKNMVKMVSKMAELRITLSDCVWWSAPYSFSMPSENWEIAATKEKEKTNTGRIRMMRAVKG